MVIYVGNVGTDEEVARSSTTSVRRMLTSERASGIYCKNQLMDKYTSCDWNEGYLCTNVIINPLHFI